MGKMKMGGDARNKQTVLGQALIKGMKEIVEPKSMTNDEVLKIAQEVMERHSDTFKRLAEAEFDEKMIPLMTMQPNPCLCEKPQILPKKSDFWARKHSLLLKNEFLKDRKELDCLLGMFAKSNSEKMVEINHKLVKLENKMDQKLVKLEDKIDMYLDLIPEEIQIVKEHTIEKPVTDKRLVIGLAISIILNIFILIAK